MRKRGLGSIALEKYSGLPPKIRVKVSPYIRRGIVATKTISREAEPKGKEWVKRRKMGLKKRLRKLGV